MRIPRSRGFYIALAGLALAILLLANAHLVYVASGSQPDCIPHTKVGSDHGQLPGAYGAAKSSC